MAIDYKAQRLAGWRIYAAGNVFVEARKGPVIYFRVRVNQVSGPKDHYLSFNMQLFEFKGMCDCVHDSYWNQNKNECVHCYAVRSWIKEEYGSCSKNVH